MKGGLVDRVIFGGSNEPVSLLLDKLLNQLSTEEAINLISETLKQENVSDNLHKEQALLFVDALKLLIESPFAFRRHLMEIYDALPLRARPLSIEKERVEAAFNLRLYLLKAIASGWEYQRTTTDAQKCFEFLCNAYQTAYQFNSKYTLFPYPEPAKVCRGIMDIIRDSAEMIVNAYGVKTLDQFILSNITPVEIRTLLLHAQIRADTEFVVDRLRIATSI
ncbi:MAG: hypothetical protein Q8P25_01220 [Candidatus Curtissbacteria bacterium]|nr:hypothetical protein [Candidatus Curtissbacteria bacterium]